MSRISLDYTFIIPNGIWKDQDDFSMDLATLFKAKGLQSELVEDGRDVRQRTTMLLEKGEPVAEVPEVPKGVKAQFKKIKNG